jgi:hypothetical protein
MGDACRRMIVGGWPREKHKTRSEKIIRAKKGLGTWHSKCEALSSNPSTAKKIKFFFFFTT